MSRKRRGREEGSVFQRGDGLWTASISLGYDANGKRKRRTVYGESKKEVQDKLRELQDQAGKGVLAETATLTVKAFLERWLAIVQTKVAPTTYARYEQHVRLHLTPILGGLRLAKLTPLHVEHMYARMAKDGDSASERAKVGTALRMALRQAVRLRLVPYNVAADIPKPKVDKEEIHPLDPAQMGAFLKAAEADRLYALYVLALDSGMRQGELYALHWPDIDFDRNAVQVRKSLEEIKGKLRLKDVKTAKARRRIDLSAETLAVLNEHRQRMLADGRDVKTGVVFCDTRGGLLRKSNVQRNSFEPIRTACQLPDLRFHDLRHTCATLLLLADENVKVVSERLGHARIQIPLDTYQHVLPSMQKRAAEKMGLIFAQARKAAAE